MPAPLADVKGVVFDLDDTLCAYWNASKAALRSAFSQFGPPCKTPDVMIELWAQAFRSFSPTLREAGWYEKYLAKGGPTRTEQMRLALLLAGVDDRRRAEQLSETYARERNANLRLFPDAIEVLERLSARYPLAMITNGPADVQRQEVETLGIARYFKVILIEGEMLVGKPEMEVFRRCEAELGLAAGDLVFVGNSYAHDMRPAMEAGWRTVWVVRESDVPPSADPARKGPMGPPEGAPEPEFVIGELRELYALLGA